MCAYYFVINSVMTTRPILAYMYMSMKKNLVVIVEQYPV